jgi:hypothetical protein
MKNTKTRFPINQIKEDRSFLFWFSMYMVKGHLELFDEKQKRGLEDESAIQNSQTNQVLIGEVESMTKPGKDFEKVLSWLRLAFDQADIEDESFDFDDTPRISDVKIDEIVENVLTEISGDIGDLTPADVGLKLRKMLDVHSTDGYSKYSVDDTFTPQSKKLISTVLLALSLPFLDPSDVEPDELKGMYDSALLRNEKRDSRLLEKEGLKNVLIYNLFNNVKSIFPSFSDYKRHLITGIMVSGMGLFVSEGEHNSSSRSTNYREYLVKSVQGNLKNYKHKS